MKIETNKSTVWINNGILFLKYKEGADIELNDIRKHNEIIKMFTGGKKIPMLLDGREGNSVSPEARDYAASPVSANLKSAQAILVDSFATKLIANFYLNYNKPPYPVKIFSLEEEALAWLMQFKSENKSRKLIEK